MTNSLLIERRSGLPQIGNRARVRFVECFSRPKPHGQTHNRSGLCAVLDSLGPAHRSVGFNGLRTIAWCSTCSAGRLRATRDCGTTVRPFVSQVRIRLAQSLAVRIGLENLTAQSLIALVAQAIAWRSSEGDGFERKGGGSIRSDAMSASHARVAGRSPTKQIAFWSACRLVAFEVGDEGVSMDVQ